MSKLIKGGEEQFEHRCIVIDIDEDNTGELVVAKIDVEDNDDEEEENDDEDDDCDIEDDLYAPDAPKYDQTTEEEEEIFSQEDIQAKNEFLSMIDEVKPAVKTEKLGIKRKFEDLSQS